MMVETFLCQLGYIFCPTRKRIRSKKSRFRLGSFLAYVPANNSIKIYFYSFLQLTFIHSGSCNDDVRWVPLKPQGNPCLQRYSNFNNFFQAAGNGKAVVHFLKKALRIQISHVGSLRTVIYLSMYFWYETFIACYIFCQPWFSRKKKRTVKKYLTFSYLPLKRVLVTLQRFLWWSYVPCLLLEVLIEVK